jgi:kynurenine formamidase
MRRWLLACLVLFGGLLVNVGLDLHAARETRATEQVANPVAAANDPAAAIAVLTSATSDTAATLDDLAAGKLAIVDLTWPLSAASVHWPGENYKPFELHDIATLEKDGVLSKAFSSPEHFGTHLDAPNHFERNQPSVDRIAAEQFFAPGVVIDVSAAAARDADYRLSVADIQAFEAAHGPIPSGTIVLAYTGWSKFWNNATRYRNQDVMSRMHFPGYSAEAVQFLIAERHVRAIGIDTLSVDYGLSRDFFVHHLLGKAGRYGLENLARLDQLPPRGFYLFVAPIKIETGSGGPTRVFAIVAKGDGEN